VSEEVPKQVAEPKVTDEIGSNTLMGCGFRVAKGELATSEQGLRTSFPAVSGSSAGSSSFDVVLHNQSQLKAELSEVKTTLATEKALNAKRHEDLLSSLTVSLTLPPPSPSPMFSPCFYPLVLFITLFAPAVCTVSLHGLRNIGYILSWPFCLIAMPCLSYYLFVRDSDG